MKERHSREWYDGRIELLRYLQEVGAKTEGAEVWRALFAEGKRSETLERDSELNPQRAHERDDSLSPQLVASANEKENG